jgi:hypothetical protein
MLLDTGQRFRGHTKFCRVYHAKNQIQLCDCVLHHVSAHGLMSLVAPSSLKQHTKLTSTDKIIWDAAYSEEFDGLSSLPSWEIINEDQFCRLSQGMKALPTMAIATIKYDEHNRRKHAKYHIVVLGHLDYHNWSKESTAAPVMSQLEPRILTSLSIYNKRVLKNCDIKQAFFNPLCRMMKSISSNNFKAVLVLVLVLIGDLFVHCMVYVELKNYGMINYVLT